MKILSFKAGHDGSIACLEDNKLKFSFEAEKDSFLRYEQITPELLINSFELVQAIPDVIAVGGWAKGNFANRLDNSFSGYFGIDHSTIQVTNKSIFGSPYKFFSSSHERSHIFCSYGLSPFPQGQPCYALIWEGFLGHFYEIDEKLNIKLLGTPLLEPGMRYSFLYLIAHSGFTRNIDSYAGKLMALTGFGESGPPNEDENHIIQALLTDTSDFGLNFSKDNFSESRFFNIGVETQEFKNLAAKFSEALFDKFYKFAQEHMNKRLPLLIGGGCGLNCEWNQKWRDCGLFSDTFVPPCTNDSGSAIGTAIDASYYFTGKAKVDWSVYSGPEFVHDNYPHINYSKEELDYGRVSDALLNGDVIAWVQGNCEIGPRALCNRSLLAEPFSLNSHRKLNRIKNRESFRPIAPVCLEESADIHFDIEGPSPFMLYFNKVKNDRLKAITHVDQTARVQTVNAQQNPEIAHLLKAFGKISGASVLCNTSLNFKEKGFINRFSDLVRYADEASLDGFVVKDHFYKRIKH